MVRRSQFVLLLMVTVLLGTLAWKIPSTMERSKQMVEQSKVQTAASMSGNAIGQQAPDFELKTLDGDTISLSDYRGKTVILNFWTTWCTYCKKEIPELINFHHIHKKDVVVLAVNLSTEEEQLDTVALFAKDFKIPFKIPLDQKGEVGKQYQVLMIPTTYIIKPDGTVKHKIVGPANLEKLEETIGTPSL